MAQQQGNPNNLPAQQAAKLATVRQMLDGMKTQMAMVVAKPQHVETIARCALTCIQKNPTLLDCQPRSLMGAVMQAAQLGLEPDDVRGLAYLVPFRDHGVLKAQLIPGYRGLQFLAMQSPDVEDIYVVMVHENDDFLYEQGSDPCIRHSPAVKGDRGAVIGAYYMIVFASGRRRFDFVSADELEKIKAKALANKRDKESPTLPWNEWEEEMQRKTVMRRACKTLPQNSRLARATAVAEAIEAGIPQTLDILGDPDAPPPAADGAGAQPTETTPTRAPRKSDQQTAAAGDTQDNGGQSSQAATPSDAGSSADSGSASTAAAVTPEVEDPKAKITEFRIEALTHLMMETDNRLGRRAALGEMAKTFGHKNLSNLTNEQADRLERDLNALT